jgi:hypothetical protein
VRPAGLASVRAMTRAIGAMVVDIGHVIGDTGS